MERVGVRQGLAPAMDGGTACSARLLNAAVCGARREAVHVLAPLQGTAPDRSALRAAAPRLVDPAAAETRNSTPVLSPCRQVRCCCSWRKSLTALSESFCSRASQWIALAKSRWWLGHASIINRHCDSMSSAKPRGSTPQKIPFQSLSFKGSPHKIELLNSSLSDWSGWASPSILVPMASRHGSRRCASMTFRHFLGR